MVSNTYTLTMAKAIKEYYNDLVSATQAKASLSALEPSAENYDKFLTDIKTPSKVGVWRAICWVMAVGYWMQDLLFDQHRLEVDQRAAAGMYGTIPWYEKVSLGYQHGDAVVLVDNKPFYSIIDESKQIIKVASPSKVSAAVEVKVAKGVAPDFQPLNFNELAGFQSFLDKAAPVGEYVRAVSKAADQLWLASEVYVDPSLDIPTIRISVEAAIDDYIAGIDFKRGLFSTNGLIAAIKSVVGVVDVKITLLRAKENGQVYIDVDRVYETASGYMHVDVAYPLSTGLTFISSNF